MHGWMDGWMDGWHDDNQRLCLTFDSAAWQCMYRNVSQLHLYALCTLYVFLVMQHTAADSQAQTVATW
jgi:hypothetical protein